MLQTPLPNFINKFLHSFSNNTSDSRRPFHLATLARAVFHISMLALLAYISVQLAQKQPIISQMDSRFNGFSTSCS